MTINYYDHNAEAFAERTRGWSLLCLYDPFTSLLAPGAHVLDAGCGPGRDSAIFLQRGFKVTGIDASIAMVQLATKTTGQPARHLSFSQIDFENVFDGIWANASLLHVDYADIDDVMIRMNRALKNGGIFYMSVKVGEGRRVIADGRVFFDYTQESLKELFARHPSFALVNVHQTPAGSKQLDPNPWLHAMARKVVA